MVDDFLNKITMYRLVLYVLVIFAVVGLLYSIFGILPFDPITYILYFSFILLVSWFTNSLFAYFLKIPVNIESFWISGLILCLIVSPPNTLRGVFFVGLAAIISIASKFILTIHKKHIFNPVAIAIAITSFAINGSASWWVGNIAMLPLVTLGGLLIVKKIRRWDLVLAFLVTALLVIGPAKWTRVLTDSPLIFFASIMITEPLTSPPTKILRIMYGALVGFLFYDFAPEIALIVGNIFAYIVSPKYKLILTLKEKIKLTHDTYDLVFKLDKPINFTPGQYMEFTFDHANPDSRGNRRYFSLANSPTESEIQLGIKFGDPASSYKKNLLTLNSSQKITAGQLIGDFTLPKDLNKKLVLIAGGIGITPYRSMLKYLVDTNQKRDIILVYTASDASDFVYADVLEAAKQKLGIETVFIDTKVQGHMDAARLAKEIPDFKDRTFYVSGSHGVVVAFEDVLKNLGIPRNKIVTDYFPGFA